MPDSLEVTFSPRLSRDLSLIKARADAKPGGRHYTVYRMIERAIVRLIADPRLATATNTALSNREGGADLRGVRRIKLGRARLFFIANSKKAKAIALHYGDTRKKGDKNDAYAEFARLLRSGEFDEQFKELDIRRPAG